MGVEAADAGQRLGDLARALALGVDEAHAHAALEQHARDRRAHAPRAEDHDVVDPLVAARDHAAPRPRGVGRPDHHHAVAAAGSARRRAGTIRRSPRMIADDLRVRRDRRLAQRAADQPAVARAAAARRTRRSGPCPSANTSVWRAAGRPSIAEIAFAVSSSGETMKSTSIWRSRHASR